MAAAASLEMPVSLFHSERRARWGAVRDLSANGNPQPGVRRHAGIGSRKMRALRGQETRHLGLEVLSQIGSCPGVEPTRRGTFSWPRHRKLKEHLAEAIALMPRSPPRRTGRDGPPLLVHAWREAGGDRRGPASPTRRFGRADWRRTAPVTCGVKRASNTSAAPCTPSPDVPRAGSRMPRASGGTAGNRGSRTSPGRSRANPGTNRLRYRR